MTFNLRNPYLLRTTFMQLAVSSECMQSYMVDPIKAIVLFLDCKLIHDEYSELFKVDRNLAKAKYIGVCLSCDFGYVYLIPEHVKSQIIVGVLDTADHVSFFNIKGFEDDQVGFIKIYPDQGLLGNQLLYKMSLSKLNGTDAIDSVNQLYQSIILDANYNPIPGYS